ncbi:helix-turn-helix domain-containing protein [Leifsonia sp. WHRI 6310E]|uniref:helix-turn-helix domain-containing protein n=1 Tax=Leifsonia sp. WHRI 6310E TaxID=3162562 RepID=UPI0032EC37EE
MKNFNLYIELDLRNPSVEKMDEVLTLAAQGDLHPAIGTSQRGYLDATITLPATNLQQAVMVGVATVQQIAGATAVRVDAMTTAEFDRRHGFTEVPELIGVTEAASILGVSRQRVLQMVEAGQLSGSKIGNSIAIPRSEVDARLTSNAS